MKLRITLRTGTVLTGDYTEFGTFEDFLEILTKASGFIVSSNNVAYRASDAVLVEVVQETE